MDTELALYIGDPATSAEQHAARIRAALNAAPLCGGESVDVLPSGSAVVQPATHVQDTNALRLMVGGVAALGVVNDWLTKETSNLCGYAACAAVVDAAGQPTRILAVAYSHDNSERRRGALEANSWVSAAQAQECVDAGLCVTTSFVRLQLRAFQYALAAAGGPGAIFTRAAEPAAAAFDMLDGSAAMADGAWPSTDFADWAVDNEDMGLGLLATMPHTESV